MERIQGSVEQERERLASRECSEMDKVMNEEIHLAEKKMASDGEEFTQRGAKKPERMRTERNT